MGELCKGGGGRPKKAYLCTLKQSSQKHKKEKTLVRILWDKVRREEVRKEEKRPLFPKTGGNLLL